MPGAVDVGLEGYAIFGDLAVLGKRIYLITSAVGQDRAIPAIEFVETTDLFQ